MPQQKQPGQEPQPQAALPPDLLDKLEAADEALLSATESDGAVASGQQALEAAQLALQQANQAALQKHQAANSKAQAAVAAVMDHFGLSS